MTIRTAVFATSAPDLSSCPPAQRPEVAFIGRSNVGKSSLINMLAGQKSLAKVSDTPGKTQLINFFLINNAWHLVDLPGYGYAKVAQEKRVDFNEAVADYLEKRDSLVRVYVLIDPRIEPQAVDLAFLEWLQGCDISYGIVFTKTDKLSPKQLKESIARFREAVPSVPEADMLACSAKTKAGRPDLLRNIDQALAQ
jgi:GTP-binding protein